MNTVLGFLIISIAAIGHTVSYRPIKKIKFWSWKSSWLIYGIFAYLLFPLLGALLVIPSGHQLSDVFLHDSTKVVHVVLLGIFWGIAGLVFGLSLRFIGLVFGQGIALGASAIVGALFPVVCNGESLLKGNGLIMLITIGIGLVGIVLISIADSSKSKQLGDLKRNNKSEIFTYGEGILIAILAGIMGSLFNLGLQAAKPIEEAALSIGINPILAGVPSIMLISIGGFMTNVAYCFERKWWKKSKIIPLKQTINNVLLALLSGGLWYLQFFALVISITFLAKDTVMGALSWSMLMMLNIAYGSIYSIMRKKWKGVSASTIVLLFIGITIVIFSTIVPKFF